VPHPAARRCDAARRPSLAEVSGGGDDGEMISGSELTAAARVAGAIRRALKRPDPVAVLKRRQVVRQELEDNLRFDSESTPEVVVIRLGKEDKYPEADERLIGWGASPWFKFEVKACQDRGLAVYSSIQHVRIRRSRARPVANENARTVFVVGRIRYERISFIDWNAANDPAYWLPRLYVAYGWRGPFRGVVLYDMPGYQGDEAELHGVKYQPKKVRPWTLLYWNLKGRRHARRSVGKHPYDDPR
jgi:hypothetical protein